MEGLAIEDGQIEQLEGEFSGQLIRPDDPDYDDARAVWNGMIDKYPALVARCRGVADVVCAVKFARTQDLLVAVRGGGHNVAGHGTCDGGVVIDLSPMDWVDVDPDARTVRVGGGATWQDVDHETQAFGLAVPGGAVSTTGVAGLTLGGGYGYLRRKYGLTCDNLRSVDVVTADGEYLTASETEHEDLFWAVRGGGGNFGIVTAFEYQLHPVGPEVVTAETWHEIEDAPTIFRQWHEFVETAPDEVSAEMIFWSVPDDPHFPEELRTKPVAIASAVYCGDIEEGERVLAPLRELGSPLFDFSGPTAYTTLQQEFDPFFPAEELRYYQKSIFLDELTDDVIDAIIERAEARPHHRVLFDVWQMGGEIDRVADDATAFSNRNNPYMLAIDSTWEDPADDERIVEWSRSVWEEVHELTGGEMYVNFPGVGEDGAEREERLRATYGPETYERLVEIKTKYDPENLFRLNQNIEPQ